MPLFIRCQIDAHFFSTDNYNVIFLKNQGRETQLSAECGTLKEKTSPYPLNLPLLKQHVYAQGEKEDINHNKTALNETMLPMK